MHARASVIAAWRVILRRDTVYTKTSRLRINFARRSCAEAA